MRTRRRTRIRTRRTRIRTRITRRTKGKLSL